MNGVAAWLLAAAPYATALVVVVGAVKLVPPAVSGARRVMGKMNRLFDVVLGTPEMPDPDRPEGPPLRPAVADMGIRMARTEELLEQALAGQVQSALLAATAASKDATTAIEVAQAATKAAEQTSADVQTVRTEVRDLSRQVTDMAQQMTVWQTGDRVKADMAVAVLHEVVRDIPPVQERTG